MCEKVVPNITEKVVEAVEDIFSNIERELGAHRGSLQMHGPRLDKLEKEVQ